MITPEDSEKFAREFLYSLRSGDFENVTKQLDPGSIDPKTEENLKEAAMQLGKGDIHSIEVVNIKFRGTILGTVKRTFLTYELKLGEAWVLARVVVQATDEGKSIIGVYIEPREKSRAEINAFTFSGKPYYYYLMLFFSTLLSIVTFYALFLCVKTGVKSQIQWIWFIVFGIGKYSLNWTSGQFDTQMLSLASLWLPALRESLDGPWLVSVSLPFGAFLYLLLYYRKKKKQAKGLPPGR